MRSYKINDYEYELVANSKNSGWNLVQVKRRKREWVWLPRDGEGNLMPFLKHGRSMIAA